MSATDNPRLFDVENPDHSPNKRQFALYTDGSGHADGYGGAAVCVQDNLNLGLYRIVCSRNRTSTARMEHEALLMGLQFVCETIGSTTEEHRRVLITRPTVFWLSDREDLVLSVAGIYKRKHNADLWCRQSWYEHSLDIHPYYAPRATTSMNILVDELAGVGRVMCRDLKAYLD